MVDDAPPPHEPASDDEVVSLPKAVGALFADLPGLLTDRVHLLALELRRASGALGQMVALGLLAAILFATAWITLWVGLAAAFLAVGLAWPWIVLLVLFVNLAAAIWAVLRVKALAPLLALPATLRRLTDSDALERRPESDEDHG
ncbi:MAG: phage holin family protein [Betaproteobacteria bacterium]